MNDQSTAFITAPKRSVLISMSERFGMEPQAFEVTIRSTCMPKETTREEFTAFLLVAKEYRLNPLLKEIYAFPKKGGGITPIVSIDGWANLINSHPAFDGMAFEDLIGEDGKLYAITCRMHRKDRSHPIEATEYMAECVKGTDPWRQWPRRMLRHKAMIQAARYAFGFAGIYDPDEGERMRDITPMPDATSSIAARLAASRGTQTADGGTQILDHVNREMAAGGARDAADDDFNDDITETEPEGHAGYNDGEPSVGGEAGNGPEEKSLSPEQIDVLEQFAKVLFRAESAAGMKTYAATFWNEAGGAPERGGTMHAMAGRIWRQHEARITGAMDAEGCTAAIEQIIGEVA